MSNFKEPFHILFFEWLLKFVFLVDNFTPVNALLAIRLRTNYFDFAYLVIAWSEGQGRHKSTLAAASVAENEQEILSLYSDKVW